MQVLTQTTTIEQWRLGLGIILIFIVGLFTGWKLCSEERKQE